MKMIKVKSSNIRTVGYSANLFQLIVEFKATDRSKAKVFTYEDVSPAEYEALMNADSVGKHFGACIKVVKECCKIDCDVIDGTLHARDLILDKVETPKPAASPWISVDDEYPNEAGDYLVCVEVNFFNVEKKVTLKKFTDRDIKRGDTKIGDWVELTHWMPLPEPPTT